MTVTTETHSPNSQDHGERLRAAMSAMRLSFSWLGISKTLSSQQRSQAADTFGAESKSLSAQKKLLNTNDPAYRAVSAIKTQATALVRSLSVPFPEPGIRLIRRESIDYVDAKLRSLQDDLATAVSDLDLKYETLRAEARERLGDLYAERDYPDSLQGQFEIRWDFPSIEVPEYLRQINPAIYRQECERVRHRFDEAVQMAENAFIEELTQLLDHLGERLMGDEDGRPKVFRDSAVNNLTDFFERFRQLSIGSNEGLDELVDRARGVLSGVAPQHLRDSETLRQGIRSQLSAIQSSLDGMLVDRPRRNLMRRAR